MYTSTPLSLLPFSLQHFLLLPSFLQASPPVFAPLFPLIILQCSILFPSIILTSLFPPMLPSLLSPSSASFPPSPSSYVASLSFSPPSSFLQASPPVFAPLFPLIILQCSILFPSIILTSLFPPMLPSLLSPSSASFPPSPSSSVASFFLLPSFWSLSFSPFSTSTLPFFPGNSSALSAYCLSPSFAPFSTLFQPLYSFFPLLSLSLLVLDESSVGFGFGYKKVL